MFNIITEIPIPNTSDSEFAFSISDNEVIKRLQTNNDLDEEYFQIMTDPTKNNKRIQQILSERKENSKN